MATLPPGSKTTFILPTHGNQKAAEVVAPVDYVPHAAKHVPPVPPPTIVPRFMATTNRFAIASRGNRIYLPQIDYGTESPMTWKRIDTIDGYTGTAGPSFDIPTGFMADPFEIGASDTHLYISGWGMDDDGNTVWKLFRTNADGSSPWSLYATDAEFTSLVSGSQGWTAYRSYSTQPLTNCGIDPVTDTLWSFIYTMIADSGDGAATWAFYAVRKLKDAPADMARPVFDLFSMFIPASSPFWCPTPNFGAIQVLTPSPQVLPLPDDPNNALWEMQTTALVSTGPGSFTLFKASGADARCVYQWTWGGSEWVQGQDLPLYPEVPMGVTVGTDPRGNLWNMITQPTYRDGFILGNAVTRGNLSQPFNVRDDVTFGYVNTFDSQDIVNLDFWNTPGFLTPVLSYWEWPVLAPLHALQDSSILLAGSKQYTSPTLFSVADNEAAGVSPAQVYFIGDFDGSTGVSHILHDNLWYAADNTQRPVWAETPHGTEASGYTTITATSAFLWLAPGAYYVNGCNTRRYSSVIRRAFDADGPTSGPGVNASWEEVASWEHLQSLNPDFVESYEFFNGFLYSDLVTDAVYYQLHVTWNPYWSGSNPPNDQWDLIFLFRFDADHPTGQFLGRVGEAKLTWAGPCGTDLAAVSADGSSLHIYSNPPVTIPSPGPAHVGDDPPFNSSGWNYVFGLTRLASGDYAVAYSNAFQHTCGRVYSGGTWSAEEVLTAEVTLDYDPVITTPDREVAVIQNGSSWDGANRRRRLEQVTNGQPWTWDGKPTIGVEVSSNGLNNSTFLGWLPFKDGSLLVYGDYHAG